MDTATDLMVERGVSEHAQARSCRERSYGGLSWQKRALATPRLIAEPKQSAEVILAVTMRVSTASHDEDEVRSRRS